MSLGFFVKTRSYKVTIMAGVKWTEEEISFIKEHYGMLKSREIAKKINRTLKSVHHKILELGLKRKYAEIGETIGRLTIIEKFVVDKGSQQRTMAKCTCTCGNQDYVVELTLLTNGIRKTCGCLGGCPNIDELIDTDEVWIHGKCDKRIYQIWAALKGRCTNPNIDVGNRYVNRGITLCDEWKNFQTFERWVLDNGYDENDETLSIERVDYDGNHCPENCKWIPKKEQNYNKSNTNNFLVTAFGETKGIFEWVDDDRCNTSLSSLKYRLHTNWNPEEAITKSSERTTKEPLKKWLQRNYPSIFDEYYNM
jgi:hypothetical protein